MPLETGMVFEYCIRTEQAFKADKELTSRSDVSSVDIATLDIIRANAESFWGTLGVMPIGNM